MKTKRILITLGCVFLLIFVVSVLAILYYKQLHPYPFVAKYEDGFLIYNNTKYLYIGSIETHEITTSFDTLGSLKHESLKTNWILNTPVLTIKDSNKRFILIPGWQSGYSVYSVDAYYSIEDFIKMYG